MSQVRTAMPTSKRVLMWVIIASFSIAAAFGILMLMGVGSGETAFRVMASTAVVGAASLGVLCGTLVLEKRIAWLGWIAMASSAVAGALALWQIWGDRNFDWSFKVTMSVAVCALACALSCLLLQFYRSQEQALIVSLWCSIAAIGVTTLLLLLAIWRDPEEWVARMNGIFAILAALGIIVTLVLATALKSRPHPAEPAQGQVALSPAVLARLDAAAKRHSMTIEQFLAPVLDAAERAQPASRDRRID